MAKRPYVLLLLSGVYIAKSIKKLQITPGLEKLQEQLQ